MPDTLILNLSSIFSDSFIVADDLPQPLSNFAFWYSLKSLKQAIPPDPAPLIICDA